MYLAAIFLCFDKNIVFLLEILQTMFTQERITFNPTIMGGKPCIRGMRVTVGSILGLLAKGYNEATILTIYPYLENEDIKAALLYAVWRVEEREMPVNA